MIHGDVKAENVLVVPNTVGAAYPLSAQLCDFGLAKLLEPEQSVSQTVRGTPTHTSPERLQDSATMSRTKESDVYAYGITVYEVSCH